MPLLPKALRLVSIVVALWTMTVFGSFQATYAGGDPQRPRPCRRGRRGCRCLRRGFAGQADQTGAGQGAGPAGEKLASAKRGQRFGHSGSSGFEGQGNEVEKVAAHAGEVSHRAAPTWQRVAVRNARPFDGDRMNGAVMI